MFGIVCVLVFVHCTIGYPVEPEIFEYGEWVPSRAAYARDFENWLNWVPGFGGQERTRIPPLRERVQTLEERQKALFDLVRCESYRNVDCTFHRTQVETIFETPSREQHNLTPPTRGGHHVTPASQFPNPSANQQNTAAPVSQASTAGNGTPAPVSQFSAATNITPAPVTQISTAANTTPPQPSTTQAVVSTTIQSTTLASSTENANEASTAVNNQA